MIANTSSWESLLIQHAVQQTGKFTMKSFIAADEFIAESESGHKSSFLQPENGTEAAAEKNTFHGGKSHQPFGKRSVLYPAKRPFRFFLYCRHGFNGMKQAGLFPSDP